MYTSLFGGLIIPGIIPLIPPATQQFQGFFAVIIKEWLPFVLEIICEIVY